jgi:hypothetical protein
MTVSDSDVSFFTRFTTSIDTVKGLGAQGERVEAINKLQDLELSLAANGPTELGAFELRKCKEMLKQTQNELNSGEEKKRKFGFKKVIPSAPAKSTPDSTALKIQEQKFEQDVTAKDEKDHVQKERSVVRHEEGQVILIFSDFPRSNYWFRLGELYFHLINIYKPIYFFKFHSFRFVSLVKLNR